MISKFPVQAVVAVLAAALAGYASASAVEPAGVSIEYATPRACHVTIAIDDASGRRVRNLVSDSAMSAGRHTAVWDGLDDRGRPLPPGTYTWKGITRDDLHIVYRGCFTHGDPPWLYGKTGGWIADHVPPSAILSWKDDLLIGSGVAEWGCGLVSCDRDGRKQWGIKWLNGSSWAGVDSEATDGERVFATGFPGWSNNWVWEVDPATGDSWPVVKIGPDADPKAKPPIPDRMPPFDGPIGLRVVGAHRTGARRWDGELFISDILGAKPRTFVYSTARAPEASPGDARGYYNGGNNKWFTMNLLRTLPLRIWGMTWLPDGRCVVALDRSLAVLDTQTGATTPLVTQGLEAPYAVTSDATGRIFVSDRGGQREWDNPYAKIRTPCLRTSPKASMQVKIFDSQGRYLGAVGREGGQKPGAVDPQALDLPGGIAIDSKSRLWITETTAIKRVSVWDIPADLSHDSPKLEREFFGPGAYGEGAYMLDPAHPNQITSGAFGITWDVDLAAQTYHPVELPVTVSGPGMWTTTKYDPDFPFATTFEASEGTSWFNLTHDEFSAGGRTYYWYKNGGIYGVIAEKGGAGEIKPLAAFGSVRSYVYECGRYSDQWVPKAIVEAARQLPEWPQLAAKAKLDPNMSDLPHEDGAWNKWPAALNFFNWTDANGDGRMQAGEITLHPLVADHGAALFFVDKDLTALMSVSGNLCRMKPLEINSLGAPRYDWSKAEPASLGEVGMPSAVLPDGSELICLPEDGNVVRFVGPDGKTRWTYPSLFQGMRHRDMDNQSGRVSVPGSIYGAWNLQGIVDGPSDLGPIFMLHTGTGVNHLMTTDGLYIGTLFKSIYDGSGEHDWENLPEAKPGLLLDNVTLSDECFNGSIARAGASVAGFESGHYYLLGLGRRVIVELTGLDTVQRLPGGSVSLGPEVPQATRDAQLARLADHYTQTEQDAVGSIPYASKFDDGMLAYLPTQVSLPNHASRMVLWHNEQGLGIAAQLEYAQDTPPSRIFTNPSPSWERDVAYGDTIDLQVGPAAAVSGAATWSAQHIALIDRDGKLEAVRYRWMPASAAPAGALVLPEGREKDMAWVADLLPIEDSAIERGNAENWRAFAVVHATIPWSALGVTYSPGMSLRADLGYAHREPGGEGVDRRNLVSETASAAYDLPTLLAMRPDLWQTFVLRPPGYVLPPRIDATARFEKGKPLVVGIDRRAAPAVVQFGGATVQVSANRDALSLKWLVTNDQAPFANGGTDWTLLFKTGGACDLQIESPTLGKCRYLMSSLSGQPVVVRFRYDAKDAPPEQGVTYRAGDGPFFVPVVEQLKIIPTVTKGKDWYTLDIDLPWSELGIEPKHGLTIPLELGLLRGDVTGTTTVSRTYWNSGQHGMVQDTPTEAKPAADWGTLILK